MCLQNKIYYIEKKELKVLAKNTKCMLLQHIVRSYKNRIKNKFNNTKTDV